MNRTSTKIGLSSVLVGLALGVGAQAEDICAVELRKAVTICSAHEHTVRANDLAIVSHETRSRVVSQTLSRLRNIEGRCREAQVQCRQTCSDFVETELLNGGDASKTIENLQECSEGAPLEHLQQISDKLRQLLESKVSAL